ncbi:hypothetical protein ACLMJK_002570 [Lecanora helva]
MPDQNEATTTNPTSKPIKLRESCDSCLIAKVKCSKSRPLCGRCLANGAPCVYSPSARSGKRNRNASGVNKSANTPSAHSVGMNKRSESPRSSVPPSATYLTRLMYPLLDEADRTLLDPDTGPLGGTTSPLLQETMHFPTPIPEHCRSPTNDTFLESSDFLPTPPFNQGDFMDFMQSPGTRPIYPSTSPSKLAADHDPISASWSNKDAHFHKQPLFQGPLDMGPVGRAIPSQMTPAPFTPPPKPGNLGKDSRGSDLTMPIVGSPQPCDCFAACLDILQSLHNNSSLLSTTQQTAPPFDIVLTINREAMERCYTLLECSECVSRSGRSISTMLLATIFGKVMSLYRAACFLRFGPMTISQDTAQLALGAYTVTGENRQLLEIEILLLELKRVDNVLKIYSEKFRDAQAEKDDATNVYNALTSYLEKNLHYIIDFLQKSKKGSTK